MAARWSSARTSRFGLERAGVEQGEDRPRPLGAERRAGERDLGPEHRGVAQRSAKPRVEAGRAGVRKERDPALLTVLVEYQRVLRQAGAQPVVAARPDERADRSRTLPRRVAGRERDLRGVVLGIEE